MKVMACGPALSALADLKVALEEAGFEVRLLPISEARSKPQVAHGADLAIVDLQMEYEEGDGDLVSALLHGGMPVVLVSGRDSPPAALAGEELSAFVQAPYTRPQILKAVESALARPGNARAVEAVDKTLREEG